MVLAGLVALAVALTVDGWIARVPILQRDTETNKAWVSAGRVRWATLTGLALGVGLTTRLGYLAWYLIPATTLLTASPVAGGLVWGVYGGTRSASAIASGLYLRSTRPGTFTQTSLLTTGRSRARIMTDFVGVTLIVALVAVEVVFK